MNKIERENRYKNELTDKTIFYNGDFRTIYLVSLKVQCCKQPSFIIFHIKVDAENSIRISVSESKENQLLEGLGSKDFRIENIASVIRKAR